MNGNSLPMEFCELERFVLEWDLPSTNARYVKRLASRIENMKEFFDAMMLRVDAIKEHLDAKAFGDYSEQDRRLGRLMFAVGVVGPAVEIFRQPKLPDTESASFDVIKETEL